MAEKQKHRRKKIRGKGKPYYYNNKVYFGKNQGASGVVTLVLNELINAFGQAIRI